jgi:hypothetical protein
MHEIPTTFRSKVVASPNIMSRLLRQALAAVVRLARIGRSKSWPILEGDLSSWIYDVHSMIEKESDDGAFGECRFDEARACAAVEFLCSTLGPDMDVRGLKRLDVEFQRIGQEKGPELRRAFGRGDLDEFNLQFSKVLSEMTNASRTPSTFFQEQGFSFESYIRLQCATGAILGCMAIHDEHPLLLLTRASKGDRQAVLDLVKVDKLFMHDSVCSPVIRKAEFEQDRAYLAQLKGALQYKRKFRRRDIMRLYFYLLAILESQHIPIPPMEDLWSILDPLGSEYKSLSAFEKDFQRRRQIFFEMIATLEKEVPFGPKKSAEPTSSLALVAIPK